MGKDVLVLAVLLAVSSSVGAEKVFYVKPTLPTTECPSPCHYLQYYANHSSFTNVNNSRFLFLEGEHHLDITVVIANVANLSLVGVTGVNIHCTINPLLPGPQLRSNPSGFYIEHYGIGLLFMNLTFSNCNNAIQYDNSHETTIQLVFHATVHHQSPLSLLFATAYFIDCTFENSNILSALHGKSSEITFQGSNLFRKNSASTGGAIQLDDAYLHLNPDTNILFEENHANYVGGAIYINDPASCFFEVDSPNDKDTIKVSFINNTADFAGSSLYGSVDLCCVTESCDNFYDIFETSNTEEDPSAIASDAADICPCEPGRRKTDCFSSRTYGTTIIAFPGQNFNVSLAVVGSRTFGGVVSSGFYGYLNISNTTLGSFQSSKVSDKHHCTNATYSLAVSTLNNPINYLHIIAANFSLLSVKVHLIDCPFGFSLSPATGNCDCDPAIDNKIITCNIDDQTFFRPATSMSWLGFIDDELDGSIQISVIFYPRCAHLTMPLSTSAPGMTNVSLIVVGDCVVNVRKATVSP